MRRVAWMRCNGLRSQVYNRWNPGYLSMCRAKPTTRTRLTSYVAAILMCSQLSCAQTKGLGANEKLADQAAQILKKTYLLGTPRAVSSKWAVEFMNAETEALNRLPKTECPGILRGKFRLETAQMTLSSHISADLLESQARLLRTQKADAIKPVLSPSDFAVGQPVGDITEKILQADILRLNGVDENYLNILVEALMAKDTCVNEEYVKADLQNELTREKLMARFVSEELPLITALMKRFDIGPLLAADERYQSRIEEARAKNPEATKAHRTVEDLRRKFSSDELLRAKELYYSALRRVAR